MQFKLKPQQYDFIGSPEKFTAYIAGIGTGKSTALIAKAMLHSQESTNNLGVIVRKNFTDLRDSTMRDFYDYTGIPISAEKKEAILPNNKSTIIFRHGDELPVLKNLNLGWFGFEQGEEFADSLAWDMLIQRLRRDVKFRTGFLIANANGHNWIWERWIKDGCPDDHECIQATTYDYKDILPKDYIESLEKNLPKKLFNRFVMNSHDEAEGRVFDEFSHDRHVVEPFSIPDEWNKGFILDHGFRNPTAVMYWAIDHDGITYLYDEHYEKEKPISHHAQVLKIKSDMTSGYADPSIFNKNQSKGNYIFSIADEYQEHGINLMPSVKEKEDAAIARVNELFKDDRIKIFSKCINSIREISEWRWREMKPGQATNFKEEPEDRNNHICDCLKYYVVTRLQRNPDPDDYKIINTPAYIMKQKQQKQRLRYTTLNMTRYRHA